MFTGLVEEIGRIKNQIPKPGGKEITILSEVIAPQVKLGDSVMVDGVCLTATSRGHKEFTVFVSETSLQWTTFKQINSQSKVHLERAMTLQSRLDGHLVAGHVDCLGYLHSRTEQGKTMLLSIAIPDQYMTGIIDKGSVAVDGVSLTITHLWDQGFGLTLIPETMQRTKLGHKKIGESVNIELDMLGKYAQKAVFAMMQSHGLKSNAMKTNLPDSEDQPRHKLSTDILSKWGYE